MVRRKTYNSFNGCANGHIGRGILHPLQYLRLFSISNKIGYFCPVLRFADKDLKEKTVSSKVIEDTIFQFKPNLLVPYHEM